MQPPYDFWHFPRRELTAAVLQAMEHRLANIIVLFQRRRTGKTEFLLFDLLPAAEEAGYTPIYMNLWASKENPGAVVIAALEAATQRKWLGWLKSIKLASPAQAAGSLEVQLAEPPHADEVSPLRLSQLIDKLAARFERPLLVFDEAQTLADSRHEAIVAALRTGLDTYRTRITAVFTGSSWPGLQVVFDKPSAPFFRSAWRPEFPLLGEEFVDFLAARHQDVSGREADRERLGQACAALQMYPDACVKLVKEMVLQRVDDPLALVDRIRHEMVNEQGFDAIYRALLPIDRAVLRLIADGRQSGLYDAATRAEVARHVGVARTSVSDMQNAITRLKRDDILMSPARGSYVFTDASFAAWVKEQGAEA